MSNTPSRLPAVQILAPDRQPLIDYFEHEITRYEVDSWEWKQVELIIRVLKYATDPIDVLEEEYWRGGQHRNEPLFLEALEMLYYVRHQLEARQLQ